MLSEVAGLHEQDKARFLRVRYTLEEKWGNYVRLTVWGREVKSGVLVPQASVGMDRGCKQCDAVRECPEGN